MNDDFVVMDEANVLDADTLELDVVVERWVGSDAFVEDIGDDGTVADKVLSELLEVYGDRFDGLSTLEDAEGVPADRTSVPRRAEVVKRGTVDSVLDAMEGLVGVDVDNLLELSEMCEDILDDIVVMEDVETSADTDVDFASRSPKIADDDVGFSIVEIIEESQGRYC